MKDWSDRDIVDRLRDSQPVGSVGGYLLNDAADEIVRLREMLHRECSSSSNSGTATLPVYHHECICPKCGLRHGGALKNDGEPPF